MRTARPWRVKAILIALVGVSLGACASGVDEVGAGVMAPAPSEASEPAESTEPAETSESAAWPFPEADSGSEGSEVVVATGPPDEDTGVLIGEIEDRTTEAWFPEEPPSVDQCSLMTVERWAEIRDVPADGLQLQDLENGRACGVLEDEDMVRVAWAVLETPTGSWLPDDLRRQGDYVDIDGVSFAELVTDHPFPGAAVLVVDLDIERTQLVVEIMARDDTSERLLGIWATEAAEALVSTWGS